MVKHMAIFMEVYNASKQAAILVNPSPKDITEDTIKIFTEGTEEFEDTDSDMALIKEFQRTVENKE